MQAEAGFHALRIAELRRETDDAVSLAFDVPAALRPVFAYTPGQYLTLRTTLDGIELRRPYSICSALDDGTLRVAIRHVPGGRFSGVANTVLRPGDRLDVAPPQGRFGRLPPSGPGRTLLALAAGSGITPILSILATTLAREPDSRAILLYGSRSTASILFRTALEDLKDRHLGRLALVHTLSREAQDIAALNGRLDAAKLRTLLPGLVSPSAIDQALLCGPAAMMDELDATLRDLGVPPDRIQREVFTPAPTAGAPRAEPAPVARMPAATATIIHDGTARTVPVDADETILDAAQRAGLDLPWSCRGGMCSTCRAKVTAGTTAMAVNFSLEPWETEAGYTLTCQTRPTSAAVTLDFDQV